MNISNEAVAAKLFVNPLFPTLLSRLKTRPIGTVFTIRGCFSDYEWESQPKDVRLSLGRLFKNNVDRKNITGISVIPRKKSNNTQKYCITGVINFVQKFMMNYVGYYDNYGIFLKELNKLNNDAVLYYKKDKNKDILHIEAICKSCSESRELLFSASKKINLNNNFDFNNHNIPSIISIWFSLVSLWINEDKLNTGERKVKNIALCSSNSLMLERCSGYRTDTSNNFNYEAIIQKYFKDFIIGNRMELNFNINAISLHQNAYYNLVHNF